MLQTKRLILRRWEEKDREPHATLNADAKVMKYMPAPLSAEQSNARIDRMEESFQNHGYGHYAVTLRETGEFIGSLGLTPVPANLPFAPGVEIGWRLAHPYWNQGYATEGALAVVMHAFEELDIPEIVSFTTKENAASQRVMDKVGMLYDPAGRFMHPDLAPDHPLAPHVLYRLKR